MNTALSSSASIGSIFAIQTLLADLGYDSGPADGVMGPRTRVTIILFQRHEVLVVDGLASNAVFLELTNKIADPN